MDSLFLTVMKIKFLMLIQGTFHFIQSIPFVGKIIPNKIYRVPMKNTNLVGVFSVLGIILTLIKKMIFCLFYYLMLLGIVSVVAKKFKIDEIGSANIFLVTFLYFSLVLGTINKSGINRALADTDLNITMLKIYRIKPKLYYLIQQIYSYLFDELLFILSLFLFTRLDLFRKFYSFSSLEILLFAIELLALRIAYDYLDLRFKDLNKQKGAWLSVTIYFLFYLACLVAIYYVYKYNVNVVGYVLNIYLALIIVVLSAIVSTLIFKKEALEERIIRASYFFDQTKRSFEELQKVNMIKGFDINATVEDNENIKGFDYINEIVYRRARKKIIVPIKIISTIETLIFIVAIAAILLFLKGASINITSKELPGITVAVFMLCFYSSRAAAFNYLFYQNLDSKMLSYNYFKNRNGIMRNFKYRLKKLTQLSMIPSGLLILYSIPIFLLLKIQDYKLILVLYSTVIISTIFFVVFYLTLNYLLSKRLYGIVKFIVLMFIIRAYKYVKTEAQVLIALAVMLILILLMIAAISYYGPKAYLNKKA